MVVKSHGARSRSRYKMMSKGRISPSQFLREFEVGDTVHVAFKPNVPNKGYPYLMFHGLTGRIIARRGNAYEVEIRDKNAKKILIVKPVHLKPATSVEKK